MAAPSEAPPAGEILFAARTDVTVEPQGEKFVIHDPRKSSFTQLGMAEYIVFRCFDGKSTTEDIVDRLKRERDVIASTAQVARLRDRLHEKQLVLAPGEVVRPEETKAADGAGIVGRMIMIELPIVWNPDLFLTRLYHRVKYVVFRPAFFVALFVLSATAFAVWLQSLDSIRLQASRLDVKSSIILYYVCTSTSLLLHECAHGLACKGFGGKVPRIGAFLYFSVIVFYTDVSASWMFPSKLRRLIVLLAGVLANLAICAISTLLWRITIQGSPINQVCFALMTINLVAGAFTLFPLLRGDGYYILSTAVDVPNLRQNARAYVGAQLRRMFIDRKGALPKATDREAFIYLCYAPLQLLFVIGFGGYVVVRACSWLVDELGFLGFWVIVLVLVDRIGRPLLRIVPGTLKVAADALRLGLSKGPKPLLALLARPLVDAAGWIARMWKLELLVALPLVLLAAVPYQRNISAPFEVISSGPVMVRTKTSGIVRRYLVSTGAWVLAGEVVAQLIDDELMLRRKIVTAEVAEARAKLAELEAGYRGEDRARAQIGLDMHRQATALAAAELARRQSLHEQGLSSRKDLDTAVAAHLSAVAREGEARAALELVAAGPRQEERDRQRARVRRAEQELAIVDQELEWTKVRAPAEGRVVTRPHELEQRIGARVAPGDGLIEVVAPAHLQARLAVPERFAGDVSVAMPVTLRFFKDPEVAYEVRLDAIEPAVTLDVSKPGGSLGMLSNLVHLDGTMPVGAKGIAKIDTGSQSLLGLLLRRADRSAWITFWSWW